MYMVSTARRLLVHPKRWVRAKSCIHTEAEAGYGGDNAQLYEKSRPSYPAEAIRVIETEILRSASGVGHDSRLLIDLGCGTGKFTREMVPFAHSQGFNLVGIEPVDAMREQAKQAVPEAEFLEGTGENMLVATSSARAVIAPQSFHWMSTAATLREVHRVLVPGAPFILIWNTRDPSRSWVGALEDIIDPFYGDDVPRQHGGRWRHSFGELEQQSSMSELVWEGQCPKTFFGDLTERHFLHSQLLTLEELDGRIRSISVIATRPESDRFEACRRAREIVEKHPDTRDRLRTSGKVELFYDTEVYWCRKLPGPTET